MLLQVTVRACTKGFDHLGFRIAVVGEFAVDSRVAAERQDAKFPQSF